MNGEREVVEVNDQTDIGLRAFVESLRPAVTAVRSHSLTHSRTLYLSLSLSHMHVTTEPDLSQMTSSQFFKFLAIKVAERLKSSGFEVRDALLHECCGRVRSRGC